jgi:hypothetical protein
MMMTEPRSNLPKRTPQTLQTCTTVAATISLQDGAAPTLDDARELFSDVPPEKSAHNQAVLGWKGLAAYMQSRPSSAIIRVMAHGISAS